MAKQVVIQSFVNHRVTVAFRYIEGDEIPQGMAVGDVVRVGHVAKTVTVPSKQESPKNILILSPKDFERIRQDVESYLDLGQRGGMQTLDSIPSGYWDPAQRVAEADGKRIAAEQQLAGAQKRIEELEGEIDELKVKLRGYGWQG